VLGADPLQLGDGSLLGLGRLLGLADEALTKVPLGQNPLLAQRGRLA
jgi:hypothetical protein